MDSISALKDAINNFKASDNPEIEFSISAGLRKPIREFKEIYPDLYYFAFGTSKTYHFLVSKSKFEIRLNDLTPRCRSIFIAYSNIKFDPDSSPESIQKLNPYLKLDAFFAMLTDLMLCLGGEQEFISKLFGLQSELSKELRKSPAYSAWTSATIEKTELNYVQYPVPRCPVQSRKFSLNIYRKENDSRLFISVDLKAASFQALKLVGLIDTNTWQEFVKRLHPHPFFANSKKLRMVAIGAQDLLSNKQEIVWQNLCLDILNNLISNKIMTADSFAVFNGDELIFHTTSDTWSQDIERCKTFMQSRFSAYATSIECFQLRMLEPVKRYFVKINQVTKNISFKCVNGMQILEAVELWEAGFASE